MARRDEASGKGRGWARARRRRGSRGTPKTCRWHGAPHSGAEGRENAARALAKRKSDPDAVRALVDLLAIESSPPLRRLTGRRKAGLLPGEVLQRLKDDLANATALELVVVDAADLRTLIELAERGR